MDPLAPEFGDGLLFLSPAVSGEVSPENDLPGSSQHPRDISLLSPDCMLCADALRRRFARCLVCARCSAISAQKDVFT
jgi:hypothetical protein